MKRINVTRFCTTWFLEVNEIKPHVFSNTNFTMYFKTKLL